MAEISNLTISVSANTDKATNNINALVNSLKRLKKAISGVTPQLSEFASSTKKIKPHLKGIAGSSNKASDSLRKVKTETKHAGIEAKKSSGGFTKLASAFKRILMYRMLRSLIRAITQSLKEGVNNVYQWSKAMDSAGYGGFAKTMDNLATSFLYLKNSLGAMVAPLIQSLAPAINWIIDRFVDLLNVVNQVFAFLSGKSSWTKAKRVPTEFGEAADKASGAAKELRDVLADFDEINLIDPGKSGGGGGGSSSSLDYEDMFEEVSDFSDIVKKLQPLKDLLETIAPIFKEIADWAVNTLLPKVLEDAAWQTANIATDVKNIIDAIKEGNGYKAINSIKDLLIDLNLGPLEALATLIDAIFGTNYQSAVRSIMEALKEFDLSGWLTDVADWYETTMNTIPQAMSDMVDAIKTGNGLTWSDFGKAWVEAWSYWEAVVVSAWNKVSGFFQAVNGLLSGDMAAFKEGAKKFTIPFEVTLEEIRAKKLEAAKVKVDVVKGRYDTIAGKALTAPKSSAKKVYTTISKGKHWSQVAYQVVASVDKKTGEKTYKVNLAKGAKWQSDAYKVLDAASAKQAAYSLDVNVNPKVKYKLDAKDLINLKDQYIKIYGTSGSVGQLRLMGSGGFIDAGQLFIANESGPELVGSMNGRTAVANNEQIVEGVASGVFRAIVNTGIVDAVKKNKGNSAPVFAPSVEAGRWIQRSFNMYQTVG